MEITQDEAHIWTLSEGKMRLAVSYRDRATARNVELVTRMNEYFNSADQADPPTFISKS